MLVKNECIETKVIIKIKIITFDTTDAQNVIRKVIKNYFNL